MSVEEKLDKFIEQYNNDRQQDQRNAKHDKYMNLMYISWGFALATLSLAITKLSALSTIVSAIITVAFVAIGWIEWALARKWE